MISDGFMTMKSSHNLCNKLIIYFYSKKKKKLYPFENVSSSKQDYENSGGGSLWIIIKSLSQYKQNQ